MSALSSAGPAALPAWSVVGASATGAAHRRRGRPNQDAFAARALADGGLVAAVADGHGAPRHHRSQTGARLAVAAALDALARPATHRNALPTAIVEGWRRAVLSDATNLADGADWVGAEAETFLAYGTTLVALRVDPERLLALQIGDGDLLLGRRGGGIERPLPDDPGLLGETTRSLCEPGAAGLFRSFSCSAAEVDFAMLSTDGLAKSFAALGELLALGEYWRGQARGGGLRALEPGLPDWLAEVSRRGSGDDATLLLAGAPASAAPPPGQG